MLTVFLIILYDEGHLSDVLSQRAKAALTLKSLYEAPDTEIVFFGLQTVTVWTKRSRGTPVFRDSSSSSTPHFSLHSLLAISSSCMQMPFSQVATPTMTPSNVPLAMGNAVPNFFKETYSFWKQVQQSRGSSLKNIVFVCDSYNIPSALLVEVKSALDAFCVTNSSCSYQILPSSCSSLNPINDVFDQHLYICHRKHQAQAKTSSSLNSSEHTQSSSTATYADERVRQIHETQLASLLASRNKESTRAKTTQDIACDAWISLEEPIIENAIQRIPEVIEMCIAKQILEVYA